MTWEALKKSINGLVNKVNVSNLKHIVLDVFAQNIIRGKGLIVRALMKAQTASPNFTHVYAALVAVINTKLPEIGELLLRRVIHQFRRAFKRNDKLACVAATRFIAHLTNQQVAHEILALQLLTLLLQSPTDDSVEIATTFVTECGAMLAEVGRRPIPCRQSELPSPLTPLTPVHSRLSPSQISPQGLNAIFERLRGVLHEGAIDKRVQYMIEAVFAKRKGTFKDHPAVLKELDLVESDDQITVRARPPLSSPSRGGSRHALRSF